MGRKEPKIVPQIMEAISSQNLKRKYNSIEVITDHRDKNIVQTNLQKKRSIFNQIINIQEIGNKLISLPTKPIAPDQIGDVVKSLLRYEWYDSTLKNY